eukprot:EC714126.1.p4 GENE.EC714126.1~~EC714126.1.p4  ORF type:complete len:53 (-),score=4.36 EC714126.1:189-347(-)
MLHVSCSLSLSLSLHISTQYLSLCPCFFLSSVSPSVTIGGAKMQTLVVTQLT